MEAITGVIGLAIEIGKCIAGPVKRQFNYLCCFNNNIQILRDEAQKLKDANDELQMKVNAAKNNAQVIYPTVERWLESASQTKDIVNGIESKIPIVQKERLNLRSRYSLSRKAKKTAEALMELHNKYCKFDGPIAKPPPPIAQEAGPLEPKEQFETRKKIEEHVMKALRDRNVNRIGLCGMGGIGKTTMAKRIMDKVKEKKLFDEVVMVVVSQQVDIFKLQRSIADQLGLKLDTEDLTAREHTIQRRVTDKKRILIVIDDVWEYLELKELGIPGENTSGRCTVLLTSRDRHVLEKMETKIFGIEMLSERESWLLFREKSGNCADKEDLHSVAKDITKECNGLPVALVTVGGALKNKTNRQLWDDALAQLRSHNPEDLPEVLTHVYQPLKLSYDSLGSKKAKSLFLLCSMFKEDFDISIEVLTWCLMGLGMFEKFRKLDEVRNRTVKLVDMLKDRFLLLDGSERERNVSVHRCGWVRMHDVVRDMGIYVTSEERRCGFVTNLDEMPIDSASWKDSYKDCSWISISNSRDTTKFSVELKFPSLRFLWLEKGEELPDRIFDEIREISILFMTDIRIASLPPTTQLLKSLKILLLFRCDRIESINAVGELSSLEVLYCCDCKRIKELPMEIGRLNRLRLLEIIGCFSLRTIVPRVISSLVSLEELELLFNAETLDFPVKELKSLTRLTRLGIEINDTTLIAQEICFPGNVDKYNIVVKRHGRYHNHNFFFQKSMRVKIPEGINLGNWIHKLLRNTEFLDLEGDGANQVNFAELENVKYLVLRSCSTIKKFVDMRKINNSVAFHTLENLEEITSAEPDNYFFKNLRKLEINHCDNLSNLFPMSIIVRSNFSQLETLKVAYCPATEGMFYNDDDNEMEKSGASHRHHDDLLPVVFPKLTKLYLVHLPGLTIQKILDTIIAPGLKILELSEDYTSGNLKDNISGAECLFRHWFNNLVELEIDNFNGIKNLMSRFVAGNLLCLKELRVWSGKTMLEVVADDEEQQQMDDKISLFPALLVLQLCLLNELRSFCLWKHDHALEMPSLETVNIYGCPKMETFTLGSLTTPRLQQISIDNRIIEVQDLNKAVQQHFKLKENLE